MKKEKSKREREQLKLFAKKVTLGICLHLLTLFVILGLDGVYSPNGTSLVAYILSYFSFISCMVFVFTCYRKKGRKENEE